MALHLRLHFLHMPAVLVEAAVIISVLPPLELTLEVVIARRAVLIARGLPPMRDYFLHPPFLRFRLHIDGSVAVAPRISDARRDVISLRLQHVSQIELK